MIRLTILFIYMSFIQLKHFYRDDITCKMVTKAQIFPSARVHSVIEWAGIPFHLFTVPSASAFWDIVDLFSFYWCSRLQKNSISAAHVCPAFSSTSVITLVSQHIFSCGEISAVMLPVIITGFISALVGDHPGPQGLGSGPYGSVQRGDQVDEGWHHPAPCRGSVRVWPLPRRSRLGPPWLQTHWVQAQSPLRDDASDQDVCCQQWWDFPPFPGRRRKLTYFIISVGICRFSFPNRHWKLIAAIIKCQKAQVQLISSI